MGKKQIHWADLTAENLIRKENKDKYILASGITPSGIVHIGNFREVITVDLIKRSLEKKGKKVRFIYSWDNYDVFRKVPTNMPQQEILKKHLREAIVNVPDTHGCHKSYAEHSIKQFEKDLPRVGINPEFLYQAKKYQACEYANGIKQALQNKNKIITTLNKWRREPLRKDWLPISGFCEKCKKDTITFSDYNGEYEIKYKCKCGFEKTVDFRKDGEVKLPWRVDWPMRWDYENVDFEPGGKDHSTQGGSYTTCKEIVKDVYNYKAPMYIMYDFISIKGTSGKMSSSKGNLIDLNDILEIYEPEIVRWLFAGTRHNKEFTISFDTDLIKLYEDFDKLERQYFNLDEIKEEKRNKIKRMYELSCIKEIPKKQPFQPSLRHLTNLIQTYNGDIEKVIQSYSELKTEKDKEKVRVRANCARKWLEKYAPEDFKFALNKTAPKLKLNDSEKQAIKILIQRLEEQEWDAESLHEQFYIILEETKLDVKSFFKTIYQILISKDKGPKLASFITIIGRTKAISILKSTKL